MIKVLLSKLNCMMIFIFIVVAKIVLFLDHFLLVEMSLCLDNIYIDIHICNWGAFYYWCIANGSYPPSSVAMFLLQ
jgi:hypothetical protein